MIVRVPLILKNPDGEMRWTPVRQVDPPNRAMEMQMLRFRVISNGKLPPPLNPQLGK